ncbi:MAG: tRNA threonylcarbamoyladenosine dehydratase [Paludibacteraceae bacterium]|nr:tRNA threonylcarbamoyladenosine dehydratase [Paludibacteraceae bacterium]
MSENESFSRLQLLVGRQQLERLASARVIIFGVGGVGSWCAEALVRSGICHLTIVDSDVVVPSNINRQLMATTATVGQPKVDVLAQRLRLINPEADIRAVVNRYNADTSDSFCLGDYDYVIDAIDSLADKALLIHSVTLLPDTQLFSSMGAARKMDPTAITVSEFNKVHSDPLARALRQTFKRTGMFPARKFMCVWSSEVLPNAEPSTERINGTVAHITITFGVMLASMVIKHICQS